MDESRRPSNHAEETLDLISVSYDLKIQECREQIRRLRLKRRQLSGETPLPVVDYQICPRKAA